MDELKKSKFEGAFLLSAVGDALGWMTEFESSVDTLERNLGVSKVERFLDWRKHVGGPYLGYLDAIKAGSYSDDTQLSLAVAHCIRHDGTADHERFAKQELPQWLHYCRGGGRTVKVAAEKAARKSVTWLSNFYTFKVKDKIVDYRDCGANGAAMRVLPIALANAGRRDALRRETFSNALITHGHPRALIGALLYAYTVDSLLRLEASTFEAHTFLSDLEEGFSDFTRPTFLESVPLNQWVTHWDSGSSVSFLEVYSATLTEVMTGLSTIINTLDTDADDSEVLQKLGCFSQESRGSGTGTVLAGLYLTAKYIHQPEFGVLTAVNALGSDTDSIAAFCGGMLGALHGTAAIPEPWMSIQDKDYIQHQAARLFEINQGNLKDQGFFLRAQTISSQVIRSLASFDSEPGHPGEAFEFPPLGRGTILGIKRHKTKTRDKYVVVIKVAFDTGQSCVFAKVCSGVPLATA